MHLTIFIFFKGFQSYFKQFKTLQH